MYKLWKGRLVVRVSYHCRVSQVESVPGEALREAVGLLSYVVFIWLDAAMWRHSLSYKQMTESDFYHQAIHQKLKFHTVSSVYTRPQDTSQENICCTAENVHY